MYSRRAIRKKVKYKEISGRRMKVKIEKRKGKKEKKIDGEREKKERGKFR